MAMQDGLGRPSYDGLGVADNSHVAQNVRKMAHFVRL
jgi:hypothetical protein